MQSPRDKPAPDEADDEAELEQREYSSPPCYLPEFEPPANAADKTRTAPKPTPDAAPDAAQERK